MNYLDARTTSSSYADLVNHQGFTHFSTFTTSEILSQKSARRLAQKIASRIPSSSSNGLKMFWVSEAFDSRDGFHLHALLKVSSKADIQELKRWYELHFGKCKILLKRGNAAGYVAKHLMRPNTDYDFL